jgi:hypothetical protein
VYPKFRHNDLHTGNLFVDDTGTRPRIAIGDFGLSVLNSQIGSHEVFRGNYEKNGISKDKTPEQYDALLFLIDMKKYVIKYPVLLSFINSIVPGKSDLSANGRLVKKYNGPSTKKMLDMLMANGSASNAANIAISALSKVPGVNVSKTTELKPSASNFLKLLPTSKAKFLKKPAALASTTPKPKINGGPINPKNIKGHEHVGLKTKKTQTMTFSKVKGNLTKTKGTNALAFVKLMKKSPNKYQNVYSLNKLFKTAAGPTKAGHLPKKKKSIRENLKLSKSPGGRIRTNKKLLVGLKRDELVKLANKYGISHSGKTKAQIANSLWA